MKNISQNIENNFYDTEELEERSKRGYYTEKIDYFTDKLSKKGKDLKILDIACNDGELSEIFKSFGDVVGIDINTKALRKCRKRGIKCIEGDISEIIPEYTKYFDVVVAGDIIEHIFDTDDFIRNIYKVLKKGGILLLSTPNIASLGRRLMLLLGINPFIEYSTELPYKEYNVGHIRYFTLKDLTLLLNNNKFKVIDISGDKINITENNYLPKYMSRKFPSLSRNLLVTCKKI